METVAKVRTDTPTVYPTDSCHRCGLRRRTRELAEQGILIRLCDGCYWGNEPQIGEVFEPPA
ncbi:MAG: hypothetical protein ACRDGN_05355 [bacterium]